MPPPNLADILESEHQEARRLKLFAGWVHPFVHRFCAVFEEKSTPHECVEVELHHKPENPPSGILGNWCQKSLYEPKVICEFLLQDAYAYPDDGLRLLPEYLYQRAPMRTWIDIVITRIIPAFHRFLQFQSEECSIDEVHKEFLNTSAIRRSNGRK